MVNVVFLNKKKKKSLVAGVELIFILDVETQI